MRKIAIKMAGLVFYMAAGFVLLFWKLERGGLHNAELLLPLAWLAGAVALGLRLDKACKQAGRWGEAAHHFFSSVIWLLLGIGFMKQAPGSAPSAVCWGWCTQWFMLSAVCGRREKPAGMKKMAESE